MILVYWRPLAYTAGKVFYPLILIRLASLTGYECLPNINSGSTYVLLHDAALMTGNAYRPNTGVRGNKEYNGRISNPYTR